MSSKSLKNLTAPLSGNNPVIVQILGICSALAVLRVAVQFYAVAGFTLAVANFRSGLRRWLARA